MDTPCVFCERKPRDGERYGTSEDPGSWDFTNVCPECWEGMFPEEALARDTGYKPEECVFGLLNGRPMTEAEWTELTRLADIAEAERDQFCFGMTDDEIPGPGEDY